MIYTQSVVPLLIIFLLFSLFSLNWRQHLAQNKRLIAFVGIVIFINAIAWALKLKTHYSMTDVYGLFVLALVVLFNNSRSLSVMRKPILFLLLLNLFFCALETQLGLMSAYVDTFYPVYSGFSEFLTSKAGLVANTQAVIRQINPYVYFVRPSGLFSNLHLSSFAIFCLFAYLNLERKSAVLQWICVFMILIGGTMQTMLCLIAYLFLCSLKSLRRIAFVLAFLMLPFGGYVFAIYGPQKSSEYNNMYRILTDSVLVLKDISPKALIWGESTDTIIDAAGAQFMHSQMLIESGVLRYTVTFGLLNILLAVALFAWTYFKCRIPDKRPYFFLIATLGTYAHYFMTTTFVGAILVVFIFMSYQHKAFEQQDGVKNIK